MLSQLEQFAAEHEALKDTWNWIDVRAIAVAEKEVGWLCDYFRAVLMATRPKRVKDLPNVEGLFVRQEVLPVDQFGKLLEMVSSGDILMGPEVVHIRQGGPGQFQPVASYNPRWFERQAAVTQFGIDFKT